MLEWLCMLCHIFHLSFHCMSILDAYFTHSRTSICFLFCQMDGQECLRTPSSYLCFCRLKLYSCYITKFDQVRFEPLCVRSTQSPWFVIDLNFQNHFVHFGLTESSTSVEPSSLSWSRFLSWCNRFEHFDHTELQQPLAILQSRCHRVVPLGHTDRVGI